MERRHYENAVVRIADLTVTTDILQDLTFQGCLILGPSVLVPLDGLTIEGCTFTSDADAMFWTIPPEKLEVVGAIGLSRVAFRECRFEKIGFAGPPALLSEMKGSTVAND